MSKKKQVFFHEELNQALSSRLCVLAHIVALSEPTLPSSACFKGLQQRMNEVMGKGFERSVKGDQGAPEYHLLLGLLL